MASKPKKPSTVVVVEKVSQPVPSTAPVKKKKRAVISAGRKVSGRDIGASMGGYLGDVASKALQTIMGQGDYTVSSNTLFNGLVRSSGPPAFVKASPGCTTIRHREYIQDIVSPGAAFSLTTLGISPANQITFPWLSNIASNFESYKFNGLIFEFITNSATAVASTNTALGTVILATQYNIDDPAFSSKLSMEQYEYAVATVPSMSAIHPVECMRGSGVLEYLYTNTTGSGDPRFSIFGNFSIATVGQQAASNIGELWVSYDIELCKSRLSLYPSIYQYHVSWKGTGASNSMGYTGSTDLFNPPTATQTLGTNNNLPIVLGTLASSTANSIIFPPDAVGTFFLQGSMDYNATPAISWTAFTATGGAILNNLFPSTGGPATQSFIQVPNNGVATSVAAFTASITIPPGLAPSAKPALFLGSSALAVSQSVWLDLWVMETTQVN